MTSFSVRLFDSLSAQLLKTIFGLYLVVAIVVTVTQLTAEYFHVKDTVTQELKTMPTIFGPGLTDSIWGYNEKLLHSILLGMNEIPAVTGVRVLDEKGKELLSIGVTSDNSSSFFEENDFFPGLFGYTFPINFFEKDGTEIKIGNVTVYSSHRVVLERVKYGFLLIVINSVIKTLALWIIFYFFLQKILSKPLHELAKAVDQVNQDTLGSTTINLKTSRHNELKMLETAFNSMISKLHQSTKDILKSEKRYRNLFDRVPVGLYRTSPDGQMLDVNPAMVQILGSPDRDTLMSTNVADFYLNYENREKLLPELEHKGIILNYESQIHRFDNSITWISNSVQVVRDDKGKTKHYEGSLLDINHQKQAEEALHQLNIKLEQRVQERTSELKIANWKLNERIKELNCLYGISKLVEKPDITLDDIFNDVVSLLHQAWQYPEIAHSRIVFDDGQEILCRHGRLPIEEKWSQSAEIKVHNKRVGVIIVFYTEEKPQTDEGVFPKEEKLLLNAIAERLGKIIERIQSEEQIKASLKEKETLLQEIHHRVKNNLTVVSSLLNLQGNSAEDDRVKEALNESQGRIHAMSAVHESLYSSENLTEIDLKSYLFKISGTLIQTYSVNPGKAKFKIDGDEIKLNIDKASPVGLTINELISNSLKYAFPDNQEGEIKINLQKTRNQIELEYVDDGVGIPEELEWKNSSTLGLKLVHTLVENQLDGSIEMESKNGTKFTIKFNIES